MVAGLIRGLVTGLKGLGTLGTGAGRGLASGLRGGTGIRATIASTQRGSQAAWRLLGRTPGAQIATRNTAIAAAALPVINGMRNA